MNRHENQTLVSSIKTEEDLVRMSREAVLSLLEKIESPRVPNTEKDQIVDYLSARNWIRGANLAKETVSPKEFAIKFYEQVFSEYFGLWKTKKAALEGATFAIAYNSARLSKEAVAPEILLRNLEGYLSSSETDLLRREIMPENSS